ncbi:hypothetical protein EDB19DRAFT_1688590 [Suillus lakei]|nr:hypothetical protein EDB19DRAFT_1688590 [Suillus lakei]
MTDVTNLLVFSEDFKVFAAYRSTAVDLWTHTFQKFSQAPVRRAPFSSLLTLEELQNFIHYPRTFYTGIIEEPTLRSLSYSGSRKDYEGRLNVTYPRPYIYSGRGIC